MGKRGNSEGSIFQRSSDGRWVGSLTLSGGRRKSVYGTTRQEASRKLAKALHDRELGIGDVPENVTVEQWIGQWLETVESTVRRSTYVRYEGLMRVHIVPRIGKVRLARLTPVRVQKLYKEMLDVGLSPTTVRHAHAVLHRALGRAVRFNLLVRNPCDMVDAPRNAKPNHKFLTTEQSKVLLEAAKGDRLEALITLALMTGCREGELLALRWGNVDLVKGTMTIVESLTPWGFSETKTDSGRRQIPLPQMVVQSLQRHHTAQMVERLAAGSRWHNLDLVFGNTVGGPISPQNLVTRSFYPLLERASLPRMRFHDLRHSAASLLLAMGVHLIVTKEILGHASIEITANLYSHLAPTMTRDATDGLGELLSEVG